MFSWATYGSIRQTYKGSRHLSVPFPDLVRHSTSPNTKASDRDHRHRVPYLIRHHLFFLKPLRYPYPDPGERDPPPVSSPDCGVTADRACRRGYGKEDDEQKGTSLNCGASPPASVTDSWTRDFCLGPRR